MQASILALTAAAKQIIFLSTKLHCGINVTTATSKHFKTLAVPDVV